MEIFIKYLPEIIFALIGLVILIVFIITFIKASPERRKKIIYDILFKLAVKAEEAYGSKTGVLKKKEVIATFYEKYSWLSFLITSDELSALIDSVVEDMTEYLKQNTQAAKAIGVESDDSESKTTTSAE